MTILTLYLITALLTFGISLKKLTSSVKYKTVFISRFKENKYLPYSLSLIVGLSWPVFAMMYAYYYILIIKMTYQKVRENFR